MAYWLKACSCHPLITQGYCLSHHQLNSQMKPNHSKMIHWKTHSTHKNPHKNMKMSEAHHSVILCWPNQLSLQDVSDVACSSRVLLAAVVYAGMVVLDAVPIGIYDAAGERQRIDVLSDHTGLHLIHQICTVGVEWMARWSHGYDIFL